MARFTTSDGIGIAYRTWADDARGHGRSDAPHDRGRYGEARMARPVSERSERAQTARAL